MNRQSEPSTTATLLSSTLSSTQGDYLVDNMLKFGAADELEWLMSLALDEFLTVHETERLQRLLRQDPEHFARWTIWQAMDSDFHAMPSVLPSPDFGLKLATRLELHERQRRLRIGVIFGLAAVVLWGSALTGSLLLGALMWSNQSSFFGGLVHNLAYWWAAMVQFGQALLGTGEALWSAPQTRTALICYVIAAAAILTGWFVFLRRSLQELPLVEA